MVCQENGNKGIYRTIIPQTHYSYLLEIGANGLNLLSLIQNFTTLSGRNAQFFLQHAGNGIAPILGGTRARGTQTGAAGRRRHGRRIARTYHVARGNRTASVTWMALVGRGLCGSRVLSATAQGPQTHFGKVGGIGQSAKTRRILAHEHEVLM
jgi:hypothetical protein